MSEDLDLCSNCKKGYSRPTDEVIVKGESTGEFRDIGSKRLYMCDNCSQKQIRMGLQEYLKLGNDVRTEPEKQ